MQPPTRDEIQRAARGDFIAQIDLDVVIARDALILASSEGIEVASIQRTQSIGYIISAVVDGARDRMRRFCRRDRQFHRRHDEALVGENFRALRMIDGHQLQPVVVIGLPQFSGDAQVVGAIARNQIIARNLVPLLGGGDARRTERVDAQPDGRSPRHRVLDELHRMSVPGEEEWA